MTALPNQEHQSEFEQQTSFRESWLRGMTEAGRQLLAVDDFDAAVNRALEAIATACDFERIFILEHYTDPDTGIENGTLLHEWQLSSRKSVSPAANHHSSLRQSLPSSNVSWLERWRDNQPVQMLVRDLPPSTHTLYTSGKSRSLLTVPIHVKGTLWGVMGFNCAIERVWNNAEISILETAAANFAGALQLKLNRIELETFDRQLQQRDALLNSVNAATHCLVANDDTATSLPDVLKILGEGTNQCRAYILQLSNDPQTGEQLFHLALEWDALGIPSKIEAGGRFPVPVARFPTRLTDPLRAGQATQFLARDLDGIAPAPGQARSLGGVPIVVAGKWWGVLGLDDCIRERVWSDAEITVLETAATAIGSAIEREQASQEKERAARARAAELETHNGVLKRRDRILAATASAASVLLIVEEFESAVSSALKILGEALETCQIAIVHVTDRVSAPATLQWKILYRWDVDSGVFQDSPLNPLEQGVCHEISEWHTFLTKGQPVSLTLQDLPKAFCRQAEQRGIQTTHCVPIFVSGQYWGMVGFSDVLGSRPRTSVEFSTLKTTAVCIGGAIEREQLRQAEQLTRQAREAAERETLIARQQAEKAILAEREQAAQKYAAELAKTNEVIGKTLSNLAATPEQNEFLGSILAEITEHIGACKAHLFIYDEQPNTLHLQIAISGNRIYFGAAAEDPEFLHHPIPADITRHWGAIVNSDRPLIYDETSLYTDDAWWPGSTEWHQSQGHLAVVFVPMTAGQTPIGFIRFCFYNRKIISNKQLEFIRALTNQAIISIQLTRLAKQSQNAALADERNRLAREIHDTLAQSFTAVSLQLEVAKKIAAVNPEGVATYLEHAGMLAREGLREARRSVRALRPEVLETADLTHALYQLIQRTVSGTEIEAEVKIEGTARPLPPDIENNLLRIAQEAFTNAIRHGKAQAITILLLFEPAALHMRVTDNGNGFDPQQVLGNGIGLIGMQERSQHIQGQLTIDSEIGRGTEITVSVTL